MAGVTEAKTHETDTTTSPGVSGTGTAAGAAGGGLAGPAAGVGATVEALEDITPQQVLQEVGNLLASGSLPGPDFFARVAKRHPLPAALLGIGLGWLLIEQTRRASGEPAPPAAEEAEPPRSEPARVESSTHAYLHARGLDVAPEDLPPMLEEALQDMHRTLFPPDPAADLSPAETAALRRGGFRMAPRTETEGSSALARTAAEYAVLRDTSLTAGETAQRLGVDPSRVRQLLAARKIYGLQLRGTWKIPIFQFADDRLLPGLEEVVPALPKSLHPVGVYRWFTMPSIELAPGELDRELSPREWLLAGYSPRVVAELAADLDNL